MSPPAASCCCQRLHRHAAGPGRRSYLAARSTVFGRTPTYWKIRAIARAIKLISNAPIPTLTRNISARFSSCNIARILLSILTVPKGRCRSSASFQARPATDDSLRVPHLTSILQCMPGAPKLSQTERLSSLFECRTRPILTPVRRERGHITLGKDQG
jgi:hypothetical protein